MGASGNDVNAITKNYNNNVRENYNYNVGENYNYNFRGGPSKESDILSQGGSLFTVRKYK